MIKKIIEKLNKVPLTVKVSAAYTVCSILQRCLSFITLPLFTRLLTTEQYGQYTIYASWSGLFAIFLTLNLAYGSFQTAMVKFEEKRAEYVASVQGICLLLTCLFLFVYYPFRDKLNNLFELPTFLVLLMISEILLTTSTQLWMAKNRFDFKYKATIVITLLISVVSPIVAYFLVKLYEEKGYARIIGYAGTNTLVGLAFFIINTHRGKRLYSKEFWKYAFEFNIPLLVYYLSQMVFNQSDRIMISKMASISDAAKYGVAYNLAMVFSFVLGAINNSYIPWLYRKIKDKKTEENKSISLIIAVLIGSLILFVIWYAPEIITIMAGEQYYAAIYVVAPVAMSFLLHFYCQLFIHIEFYYEEKNMLVVGAVGAAVLNIVLNYLFIPIWGFVVAGYTTLISYIVFALANCYTMKFVLKKRGLPDNFYNYKALLLLFFLFMVSGFLGVALYKSMLIRILLTLVVLVVLFVYRDKFISAFKKIKENR